MTMSSLSVAQTLLSVLLGFPSDFTQTPELERAPSFARLWREGWAPTTECPLLFFPCFFLLCDPCALCDLCVSSFLLFLSTFNFELSTPEPVAP